MERDEIDAIGHVSEEEIEDISDLKAEWEDDSEVMEQLRREEMKN